jgi:hypothetical protein
VRRVNGRTLLSVGVGVLLTLPLVLLLGGLLRPEDSAKGRVTPILDNEQRARLMTYGRPCEVSSECESPLGCLFQARTGYAHCIDSQCTTDTQCPEGQQCQTLATEGDGPRVRFCVAMGVRQEGEGCVKVPGSQQTACVAGLLCGGQEGWCARPCQLGVEGCPEGFFCADTIPQPACLPTCQTRGCPEGQRCVQFEEGASVCARVFGPDCRQAPCPEGRKCEVYREPPHPGKVWMECVQRCGEGSPACDAGQVCADWRCLPGCDPQGPEVCGEGYRCRQRSPSRPYACHPDWW